MENSSSVHLLLLCLAALNLLTLLVFGWDKWQARRGGRRVPERTLLLLALMGGSMGAWLGMQWWHHKTLHARFRLLVPLFLLMHAALWGWWLFEGGF